MPPASAPAISLHNTFSYHLTPAGAMVESAAQALGCPVIPAGTGQTEQQLRTIADLRPVAYVGTPSFLKILLDRAAEQGSDIGSLKKALVGAEAFPSALRVEFGARGIAALQCYGTADLGLIAYESRAPDGSVCEGMVLDEGVILELVRPGTGEPVAPGEVGEVVVTTLDPGIPADPLCDRRSVGAAAWTQPVRPDQPAHPWLARPRRSDRQGARHVCSPGANRRNRAPA